jgi:hypothetical protein
LDAFLDRQILVLFEENILNQLLLRSIGGFRLEREQEKKKKNQIMGRETKKKHSRVSPPVYVRETRYGNGRYSAEIISTRSSRRKMEDLETP